MPEQGSRSPVDMDCGVDWRIGQGCKERTHSRYVERDVAVGPGEQRECEVLSVGIAFRRLRAVIALAWCRECESVEEGESII